MSNFIFMFLFLFSCFAQVGFSWDSKMGTSCPEWMERQIEQELSFYKKAPISSEAFMGFFKKRSVDLLLVKFSIFKNKVYAEYLFNSEKHTGYRIECFKDAFTTLCKRFPLPNVEILISMHDGLQLDDPFPVLVMSKQKNADNLILIPDFEALKGKYQVLEKKDVIQCKFPWSRKRTQMIWRGSTAQCSLEGDFFMKEDNVHLFSRVTLCLLSFLYPSWIDAKFTLFAQGGENIPYLQQFRGDFVSFEKQFEYKYHIFIDGNSCPYSASAWKFFSNSLIFKPESNHIQWYYRELKPGIHYLPVKANLDDLMEKIQWAAAHDEEAEAMAQNARQFAINHLTIEDNLMFLYQLILRYSQLTFADKS